MFTRKDLVFPMPEDSNARYLREIIEAESIFLEGLKNEPTPLETAYATYISRVKAGAPLVEIEGMAQVIRYIEKLPYMARKDFLCTIYDDLESAARGAKKERDETVFTFSDGTTQTADISGVLNKIHYTIPSGQQLTKVAIGLNVTAIDDYIFSGCKSLTSVTIPDSVMQIGFGVFQNCISLTSVDIPSSIKTIESALFWGCTSLTSITILDSVNQIMQSAFHNCSSLTSIRVSSNNLNYKHLDGVLLSKDGKTLIQYPCGKSGAYTIPNSVTTISNSAFRNCTSLTSIVIPNSVTTIEEQAFRSCTSLSRVDIPDSVNKIGYEAFLNVPYISYQDNTYGSPWGALSFN